MPKAKNPLCEMEQVPASALGQPDGAEGCCEQEQDGRWYEVHNDPTTEAARFVVAVVYCPWVNNSTLQDEVPGRSSVPIGGRTRGLPRSAECHCAKVVKLIICGSVATGAHAR